MNKLKWWMRIVAALYLAEGIGITLMALLAPEDFGALWASTAVGALDGAAVRGIRIAGLPGALTWVLLGAMLLVFSRDPGRARVLVLVVACWELLVWLPTDLVAAFNGFAVSRTVGLVTVHAIIGLSGLLLLRSRGSSPSLTP